MVVVRQRIEEAEERARLAIEAAEIGTFDLDMITNTLLASERCNNVFGFNHSISREIPAISNRNIDSSSVFINMGITSY